MLKVICLKTIGEHEGPVTCLLLVKFFESDDNKMSHNLSLISGSHDKSLRVRNFKTGCDEKQCLTYSGHLGHVNCLAYVELNSSSSKSSLRRRSKRKSKISNEKPETIRPPSSNLKTRFGNLVRRIFV